MSVMKCFILYLCLQSMKFNKKIVIDFKDFLSTGKFDCLKPGKSKKWILNNFPDPDGFNENHQVYKDDIWLYGNIELHFNEGELFMIFSDYIDQLHGGESLDINKWILQDTERLKLSDIILELNKEHVDFTKRTNRMGHISANIELLGGVKLDFSLPEIENEGYDDFRERCRVTSQNDFKLMSFSLM